MTRTQITPPSRNSSIRMGPALVPRRLPFIGIGIVIGMALATAGLAGCAKTTSTASGTQPSAAASQASSPSSAPATGTGAGTGDWCALAIRIATDSGIMVNKHYIPPQEETLAQLTALVNASLAARDQLLTGIPAEVRSALEVELAYFQALKDNNFSSSTPAPAGLDSAVKTVNQFQVSQCGVVFDK